MKLRYINNGTNVLTNQSTAICWDNTVGTLVTRMIKNLTTYCIAKNFQCFVAIHESFLSENRIFYQFAKVFFFESFPLCGIHLHAGTHLKPSIEINQYGH